MHRATPDADRQPRRPACRRRSREEDWYAIVRTIERRKCLHMVHAYTLFAVLDTDVHVAKLMTSGSTSRPLSLTLASEGLADTALGPTDPAGVRVAKTARRSVLGHLNEMAFEVEHAVASSRGLRLAEVNRRLRRGLHGRDGDYVVPLELARAPRLTPRGFRASKWREADSNRRHHDFSRGPVRAESRRRGCAFSATGGWRPSALSWFCGALPDV